MDLLTTIMICSVFHTSAVTNAIIEQGSKEDPLAITTINSQDKTSTTHSKFKTASEAASYARQQLAQGNHIEIGMMQIPSGWLDKLSKQGVTLDDLLRPCRNIAVATDLLNQSEAYCATITDNSTERDQCTLSFYKTANPKDGLSYAHQILSYAKEHPAEASHVAQKIDFDAYENDPNFALPKPNFGDKPVEAQDNASEDVSASPAPVEDANNDSH